MEKIRGGREEGKGWGRDTERERETDMRERMIKSLSKPKCVLKPQKSNQGKNIIHLCLIIHGHSTNL